MRGRFITLEGLEGSGKSTQIPALKARLVARGLEVVTTREPGGTPVAEKIREVLLHPAGEPLPPTGELLLMFAARAAHLQNLILPTLTRGAWVLCDRFTDATYAYQGAGRGIPAEHIRSLERLVQGRLQPDLTLLLDVPVDVGLQRASKRRGAAAADRFEQEQQAFFERVRTRFLELARENSTRIRVVDANRAPEAVTADLERLALELLDQGQP